MELVVLTLPAPLCRICTCSVPDEDGAEDVDSGETNVNGEATATSHTHSGRRGKEGKSAMLSTGRGKDRTDELGALVRSTLWKPTHPALDCDLQDLFEEFCREVTRGGVKLEWSGPPIAGESRIAAVHYTHRVKEWTFPLLLARGLLVREVCGSGDMSIVALP